MVGKALGVLARISDDKTSFSITTMKPNIMPGFSTASISAELSLRSTIPAVRASNRSIFSVVCDSHQCFHNIWCGMLA